MYDVIIIGGGPAGLTAAVYCRRAGKSVLVLEKNAFGGQIVWSPRVENFPAIASISGTELGDRFLAAAMDQGAEVELDEAVSIADGPEKTVRTVSGGSYKAKAVILATGAKPRELGLPGEADYIGNGECFCAVCDGAFYAGRPVAVMGGGNSALQDAVMLAEKSSRVYLIHRRAEFRGEEQLVERLQKMRSVEFVLESRVTALHGEGTLTGITVENASGRTRELAVDGLFVAVGREPVNGAFADCLALDAGGYALSGEDCLTKTRGVFVAGDCRAKKVRQLTTAAADGSVAALAACAYIDGAN